MNPDRRSRRSPIFQVMFGYERYVPPVANEFHIDADPGMARYDLSLHLWETANGDLMGAIEYCTDLFAANDIDRLWAHGDALLAEIVRDPDQQILESPIPREASTEKAPPTEKAPSLGKFDLVSSSLESASKMTMKSGLFLKSAQMLASFGMGRSKRREGISVALED